MNDVCKYQVLPPVLYLVPNFNINRIYWFIQISVSQQTFSRMHCADLSTGPSLLQQKALQFSPEANTYLLRRTKQLLTFQKTSSVFRPVQLFTSKYYYSILQSASTVQPCHAGSTDWSQRKPHFRTKKSNQIESGKWNSTAQAHIKKVLMLKAKVERDEPLIKEIFKRETHQNSGWANNPSAFQLTPATVTSMPH